MSPETTIRFWGTTCGSTWRCILLIRERQWRDDIFAMMASQLRKAAQTRCCSIIRRTAASRSRAAKRESRVDRHLHGPFAGTENSVLLLRQRKHNVRAVNFHVV